MFALIGNYGHSQWSRWSIIAGADGERLTLREGDSTEHFWNTKAFLLNDLAERHPSIREALREYIDGIIKADRAISASTPAQNMLKRFKKSLE